MISIRTKGLETNELTSDAHYVDVAYNMGLRIKKKKEKDKPQV